MSKVKPKGPHIPKSARSKKNGGQKKAAGGGDASVYNQVSSLANLEFRGSENLLKGEIRREQAHTQTIGQAFDRYKTRLDELLRFSQASQADAAQQYRQFGADAAAGVAPGQAQEQAGLAQRAQTLGFGGQSVDTAKQVAGQDAATLAGQRQGHAAALIGAAAGATTDLALRAGIGERERIDQLDKGRKRVDLIEDKQRELAGQKRDFRVKALMDLQRQQQETYVAITGLRQKALSEKADRRLRKQLGMMDLQAALAKIASQEKMNTEDNQTAVDINNADNAAQAGGGGAGGGGGGKQGKGGLSPSQRREWNQLKSKYQSGAAKLRKNLRHYKDRESAWHATAQELGGQQTRADMVAYWWIAKGGKIPKDVKLYLRSKFPGGKSPWG